MVDRALTSEGLIEIHTSDRILFKRCRRKWDLSSPIRKGLEPEGEPFDALWYGTGFHFALEDYHGWNVYGDPYNAFQAFCRAFREGDRPSNWRDLLVLAEGMLSHYLEHWLPRRKEFKTLWLNGIPQVEVQFQVPIPGFENIAAYVGTLDRVVIDTHHRLWMEDYKTAKTIDVNKITTDPQVTSYAWGGGKIYGDELVEGVLYTQFLKKLADQPIILKDGKFSLNKQQKVTYSIYRKALREKYGGIPRSYLDFLNYLASLESPEGDGYIRRDVVRRNEFSRKMEEDKIRAEAYEMLHPGLPLYPNPTRDCTWDCSFRSVCLSMDDGSDYQYMLEAGFVKRKEIGDLWRNRLQLPEGSKWEGSGYPPRQQPLRPGHLRSLASVVVESAS